MKMQLMIALIAVIVLASAGDAHVPETPDWEPRPGVTLGLQLQSTRLSVRDTPPVPAEDRVLIAEEGGGAVLSVGYTFTPRFALLLAVSGSVHETDRPGRDVNLATAVLEAHYRIRTGTRWQPFFFGGLGGATVRFEDDDLDAKIRGGVAVAGAGVNLHLSRRWRLELAGRLDFINWDRIEVERPTEGGRVILEDPVDEEGRAGKIHLGAVFAF